MAEVGDPDIVVATTHKNCGVFAVWEVYLLFRSGESKPDRLKPVLLNAHFSRNCMFAGNANLLIGVPRLASMQFMPSVH